MLEWKQRNNNNKCIYVCMCICLYPIFWGKKNQNVPSVLFVLLYLLPFLFFSLASLFVCCILPCDYDPIVALRPIIPPPISRADCPKILIRSKGLAILAKQYENGAMDVLTRGCKTPGEQLLSVEVKRLPPRKKSLFLFNYRSKD
ncbi:hypothetical protein L1049_010533 [Liquidambar formosana]|uniref:Uncharacterized protein n=1 Tax=Liquidambar formosana TaxID=63359 RepID=A0AAP0R4H3_LIQFO